MRASNSSGPNGLGRSHGSYSRGAVPGRHFDQEIVVLCVRWYLSYKLSYRNLVAMMGEGGIDMAHTTILRWVQPYTPQFQRRWNRFARPLAAVGAWTDVNAAKAFLHKAMNGQRIPTGITLDAYASSHRAVADVKAQASCRNECGPTGQATAWSDARTEDPPKRSYGHRWHRVGGEDQEGPVQDWRAATVPEIRDAVLAE
jgi:hypothetical protein